MAMENTVLIRDFPVETTILNGFPLATLDCRRVYGSYLQSIGCSKLSGFEEEWLYNVGPQTLCLLAYKPQ